MEWVLSGGMMNFEFFAPFLGSIAAVSGDAWSWMNQNAAALDVVAAVLTMLSTILYTWVTYKILRATRDAVQVSRNNIDVLSKLEVERARAQVVVDLIPSEYLMLRVRNLGATPARNVIVRFNPPLMRPFLDPSSQARLTMNPISWLVPEQELVEYIGQWAQVKEFHGELNFAVEVEFWCHDDSKVSYNHTISLGSMADMYGDFRPSVSDRLRDIHSVLRDRLH